MSEDTKDTQVAEEPVIEETQEETPEVEEVSEPVELTTEDYYKEKTAREAAEKKAKELEAQKDHWKKKAERVPLVKEDSTNQDSLKEELILIAKGVNEDVIEQASLVAKAKGISIKDALNDPMVKAYSKSIEDQIKKDKAQLSPSAGTSYANDSFKPEQPRDEHKEAWAKAMKNV